MATLSLFVKPGGIESYTAAGVTQRNVHPRMVMAILGHSHIALTMNTYSHWIVDETGHDVAEQMDEILSGCDLREDPRVPDQQFAGYRACN